MGAFLQVGALVQLVMTGHLDSDTLPAVLMGVMFCVVAGLMEMGDRIERRTLRKVKERIGREGS